MAPKYRICFLGYGQLSELARPVLEQLEFDDTEVLLVDCNVESLPGTVNKALADGYDMFIAGSANAAEFRRYSYAHLVEISIGTVDYLLAIKKALTLGQHPVIATYSYGRELNIPLLEELSGAELELVRYEDSLELEDGLAHAKGDVIIGASHASELAARMGHKSVLLSPGANSILSAVRRARNFCMELEKERQNSKTIQAILNNVPVGLIVSDAQGAITLCNPAARQFTQLGKTRVLGKLMGDVLPTLSPADFLQSEEREQDRRRLLNGSMIRCVQSRIEDNDRPLGVLTTLFPDNSRRKHAEEQNASRYTARSQWKDLVGTSPAIKEVVRQANACASSDYPLVLEGEGGSGRNFIAQCIHNGSLRAKEPYLPLNTAILPDAEAARVLFGSEDSRETRPGLLELAQGGTIVLQNLPAASFVVQSCLLQVLTQQHFFRLGGTTPVPFRARFVTILAPGDAQQSILPDLRQRLGVLRLCIPPLRKRREDIVPLFTALLAQECELAHLRPPAVAREPLERYAWPENLSELSAACKRYVFLLSQSSNQTANARYLLLLQAIGEDNLFRELLAQHPALADIPSNPPQEVLAGIEDIKHLLKYNNDKVAEKLNLSRTTLWRMLKSKEQKE